MFNKRCDRVGDLIRKEIAGIVQSGDVKDPRIGFVTITHVKMTPDLKLAKVYFSLIGSEADVKESLSGLTNASGYIRRQLGALLSLKSIPKLKFYFDDTLEYSAHMEKVFRDMHGQ